jgi:hypothetical protein
MRDARLFRRVVLWLLVIAIGLPPSPAAAAGGRSQWSRVTALKPDTHVIVAVAGRSGSAEPAGSNVRALEGWLGSADASGLVLRLIEDTWTQPKGMYTRSGDVAIPRERVVQVVVVKSGRPWWAVPLIVAALAAGVAVCVGVAVGIAHNPGSLSGVESDTLGPFAILAVLAVPVIMVIWAGQKADNARSEKVIYQASASVEQAGR